MRHLSRRVKENRAAGENKSGWDAMIDDAKERIRKLEASIGIFERRKAAGEPWPSAQLQNQQH